MYLKIVKYIVRALTIAIVPQKDEALLLPLGDELKPDARAKRRLERKLDRQRRANNPHNYDEKGRIKKRGKGHLVWKNSKGYLATRRRLAAKERKLAAHLDFPDTIPSLAQDSCEGADCACWQR